MAHRVVILEHKEELLESKEAQERHGQMLEEASGQLMNVMPRVIRRLKHQSRNTAEAPGHLRDMGDAQIVALFALATAPRTSSELARHFHVTNPTMSRIADGLVEKGLVERVPDPEDRRCYYLQITGEGREVGKLALKQGQLALADLLKPLSEHQLADILLAFKHLDSLLPEDAPDRDSHGFERPAGYFQKDMSSRTSNN
jgi:DNA-binding MarR family transcriptional regulator